MISIQSTEETSASLPLPDLTPLLDVVFIVMVFLLFTANVQTLSLPVELPQATEAEAIVTDEPKTVTVSILAKGQPWALEEERFTDWSAFTDKLLAEVGAHPETTVLIAGDKEAPLGNLVKLMMFLGQHDIKAAQVLMEETAS
ncbi:ExbD/TolR family protein [Candidatus Sororendozoicomonas aggregata]|uniref:ExbD/TolR family protein n=1 Tax=Candidatus Sororendozoicomonas aggregata TaxID=3073239 RepID=UPI002ED0BA62